MIDNKKIEEAAKILCGYGSIYDSEHRINGFKKGVKWATEVLLKDLWHDAEEEPYNNLSLILLDGRDREGRQIIKTSFFRSGYWNKTVKYYDIIRWLYIDDLFPEEEEEEE